MKQYLFFVVLMGLVFLQQGCSPFTKVYSEEEPGINLYQYYSYAWLQNNGVLPGDPVQYRLGEAVESKIRDAVDKQMSDCGYKICDNSPDFLLHFHVVVKNKVYYLRDWECQDGVDQREPIRRSYCQRVRPVYFQEGTLILDFMDAQSGQQIWRGVAVGIIENMSPEQLNARIDEAVRQIFKKYPIKPLVPAGDKLSATNPSF